VAASAYKYEDATPGEYRPVRGLFDSVSHLLSTLGSLAQAHLELLTTEIQEHVYRAVRVIVRSIAVLLASWMGLFMAAIALILSVADERRPWVAGGIAAVFLLLALALGIAIWLELREQAQILKASIEQFRKDGAALHAVDRWQDTSSSS
jgi:uncharacterized membrane protein YqjE